MEVITVVNRSRDKLRVALFEQPASPDQEAIAVSVADVQANSRSRLVPDETGADLYLAIVRSVQAGGKLPAWAVAEAVPIQNGQTATVSGSVGRGYLIRVK